MTEQSCIIATEPELLPQTTRGLAAANQKPRFTPDLHRTAGCTCFRQQGDVMMTKKGKINTAVRVPATSKWIV